MSQFQLYDFNGSVKKNKHQEAVFNTMNGRQQFLHKMAAERRARAEGGKRNSASKVIQAVWRGHRARQREKRRMREEFDNATERDILESVRKMAFFYSNDLDRERLTSLVSAWSSHDPDPSSSPFSLRLYFATRAIFPFLAGCRSDSNVNAVLRFPEILFKLPQEWLCLVHKGYFSSLVSLIAIRSSSASLVDDRENTRLPGYLEAICDMILVPFRRHPQASLEMLPVLLSSLSVCPSRYAAICFVLNPFLARRLSSPSGLLPFPLFLVSPFTPSIPLLHLYLFLFLDAYSESIPDDIAVEALAVLASLSQSLSSPPPSCPPSILDSIRLRLSDVSFCSLYSRLVSVDRSIMGSIVRLTTSCAAHRASLHPLADSPPFLRALWQYIWDLKCSSTDTCLLSILSYSRIPRERDRPLLTHSLALFCWIFGMHLRQTDDSQLVPLNWHLAFSEQELRIIIGTLRDVSLGLIHLAYPDHLNSSQPSERKAKAGEWENLYEGLVRFLGEAYRKDTRCHILPKDFWSTHGRQVILTRQTFTARGRMGRRQHAARRRAFVRYLLLSDSSEDEDGPSSSSKEVVSAQELRNGSIIRSIPFVVPFMQRVHIFEELIQEDKAELMGLANDAEIGHGSRTEVIDIRVRRVHLYEDAFSDLSKTNAPCLRYPIRVTMTNWTGVSEAGIDGGGIFREFLSELFRQGFDVSRGLFRETSDHLLYPNPLAPCIYPDYQSHFFFLGRMLGKALYEKQLCDVRFAEFFLSRLLGTAGTDADLSQMKSFDPVVYKNLQNVREMEADKVEELELDFSIIIDQLGNTRKIDLKENGRNIRVTGENRHEYIQLYVNYFLHEMLDEFVCVMREGVEDVLDARWMAMFSADELQVLVSGEDADIDVTDLERHAVLHNARTDRDKEYIAALWSTISSLSADERRLFVKFVTGCPRPPLGGFSAMNPKIGVQITTTEDRLPSSAACMNLLKLPRYRDPQTLRERLLYAINAGAGFELS